MIGVPVRPLLAGLILVATACGGDGAGPEVASLVVTAADSTVFVASNRQLTATATDASGQPIGATVTWTSADPTIASISSGGVVTGLRMGTVQITAAAGAHTIALTITVTGFTLVAAAEEASCGLAATGLVYCWGSNFRYELGVGGTSSTRSTKPIAIASTATFTTVSAQQWAVCAIATTNELWCWGSWALATGAAFTSSVPTQRATGIQRVAAGDLACLLTTAAAARCWGTPFLTHYGGDGGTSSPTDLAMFGPDTTVTAMATNAHWGCGLVGTGETYCWGQNGLDSAIAHGGVSFPTPLPNARLWAMLAGGGGTMCGVETGTDAAYCWGTNQYGQLGTTAVLTGCQGGAVACDTIYPVPVEGGHAFRAIATSGIQTCAITTTGTAYCWGNNAFGQLGDGTSGTNGRASAQPVAGTLTFAQIATGAFHTCAVTPQGAAYCWGRNDQGQVGQDAIGTNMVFPTPTLVLVR